MKKTFYAIHILPFLIAALMVFQGVAQNYAVVGSNIKSGSVAIDSLKEFTIDISNTKTPTGPLVLTWDVVSSNFPTGWFWTLCDKGECFNGVPATLPQTMDTVQPTQYGFFKLSVIPNTLDSGILKLVVYESGTTTPKDTVEFHIASHSNVGLKDRRSADVVFAVAPNPGKEIISMNLKNTPVKIKSAKVFDILGNVVMTLNNDGKTDFNKVNIVNLQSGVYIVRMVDQEGAFYSRRFYKN